MEKLNAENGIKDFSVKKQKKRKTWLKSRGFNPILFYNPSWAFPYVLKWEIRENYL